MKHLKSSAALRQIENVGARRFYLSSIEDTLIFFCEQSEVGAESEEVSWVKVPDSKLGAKSSETSVLEMSVHL